MDMRMPSGIVTEDLDGQGDTRNPQLFSKIDPEKAREEQCCTLAQLAEQFTIIEKISTNDFENELRNLLDPHRTPGLEQYMPLLSGRLFGHPFAA